jgi:hypothetical protein
VVELMVGRSVMSVVVAEHTVERERKERIIISFKPSNPPLFIGDGRGQSCLH